jgi:pSer/pThr/pTyr-binding forkhead associated (FHA) protein
MTTCPTCGRSLPADLSSQAQFCPFCGARLERALSADTTSSMAAVREDLEDSTGLTEEDRAAVDALPEGSALLVVLRGPNAGARFLLDEQTVAAGRHPSADVFLDDVTVSRRHAEFRRTPDGYAVRDVGSLNGTYVNRDRIDEVLLRNADEVQIGKFRLVYYASGRGFGGAGL